MRNPNDRISREMVETLDTVAINLDRLFTTWVQKHNPQHSPGSASTTVGGIALDITLWETGSILIRGPRVIEAAERISLSSERLALQSQRALQKEAMALERLTQPALRGGIVSDKTVAKLGQKATNPSLPIEQGGRRIGRFQYTNESFKHFNELVKKGNTKGMLARPYMRSLQTIREIMAARKPIPDPFGTPGTFRWNVPGTFRGSDGMWELVVHPETNSIYHYQFKAFKS